MANQDAVRDRLMQVVRTINNKCMEGEGFDEIAPLFHEDFTVVHPRFAARARGRGVSLKCYEEACAQMTFEKLDASEEQVDVYGSTAILSYKYDCVWEFKGRKLDDEGHELLVFVKDDEDWKVAWRTLMPGSRQAETCPTEEEKAPIDSGADTRRTCLDMMTAARACYLTTIDADGFPQTTAMLNLRCAHDYPSLEPLYKETDNEFLLYMSTGMQSGKMARMQANPKVSVYFCDPGRIIGFMLGGKIEIITDQALKNRVWQDGWTMYYPNGPEGPEYGVLRLAPTTVKGWRVGQPFQIDTKAKP
jgi:general stress protein 26